MVCTCMSSTDLAYFQPKCIVFYFVIIVNSFPFFILLLYAQKKFASLKFNTHDARPIFKCAKIAVFFINSMLAEKLNMTPEEAERWIVNLIRNARLDAKIDSKLVRDLFVWYIAGSCKGLKVTYPKSNNWKLFIFFHCEGQILPPRRSVLFTFCMKHGK